MQARALLPLLLFALVSSAAAKEPFRVVAPPAEAKLPEFYQKYVDVRGFPVVGSEKVPDYALLEAAYLIDHMLAGRQDVLDALTENRVRFAVMAASELTTDVPEHSDLTPKRYWDRRARGLGPTAARPAVSCGEENLLRLAGDPYREESILIHEFAHAIHQMGLNAIDDEFDTRLRAVYDRAMEKGLWKGKYAATNYAEYWAEGVQSWFDTNRPPDHDHNHVDTREELKRYDPELAKLIGEVFGDSPWRFVHPHKRLQGHLAGFDPKESSPFAWPEKLNAWYKKQYPRPTDARKPPRAAGRDENESKKTRDDPTRQFDATEIEGWKVYVNRRLKNERQAIGAVALELLRVQLWRVAHRVPAAQLAELRKVAIWLDDTDGPAQYHPDKQWLVEHGFNPDKAKSVDIRDPDDFVAWSRDQPWMVLHELAHAYHDQVLGFDEPRIRARYEEAVESKKYDRVLHISGRHRRHYALSNHKEYFAEATEAFFGTNDFYPFTRAELAEHDPAMFELLEKIWGARNEEKTE